MPRHHYVPQFYLREFVDPDTPAGQEPYLWVHEPGAGWKRRAPQNIAEAAGFYAVPDPAGGSSEFVENTLAQIEGVVAPIFRDILAEHELSHQQRAEFATYLAIAQLRVPGHIDHVSEAMAELPRTHIAILGEVGKRDPDELKQYLEHVAQAMGTPEIATMRPEDFDPEKYRITTSPFAAFGASLAHLGDTTMYYNSMSSTFVISRDAGDFITSDYPVATVDPYRQTVRTGFGMPNAEVSFPLSRTMALVMRWCTPGSTCWMIATKEDVEQINCRTAVRARQIFAPKPDFPGSDRILTDRQAPLELQRGARVTHLEDKVGYRIEVPQPPAVPRDFSWLGSVLPANINRRRRAVAILLDLYRAEQRSLASTSPTDR